MRKFVIGDIHGGNKALLQCLDRSNFNYAQDQLIVLGDIVDGWPETPQVIEELLKIKNLILIEGNHDCLSDDTECLTKRGWVNYDDLKLDDFIYSFDVIKNYGVWDKINKIIIKDADKELINFKTENFDLLCSKTHRILHKKRLNHQYGDLIYQDASSINGRCKIPLGVKNNNKGINLSDNELKLIAWFLTDGNISKNGNYIGFHIYQSKKDRIEEIKKLLESMDYKYNFKTRTRSPNEICGRKLKLSSYQCGEFSFPIETTSKIKKYLTEKYPFPKILFDINFNQFSIFLEELIKGDGSFYKHTKNSFILYGTSEFLSNIQILCIINGYKATLAKSVRGDFRLNINSNPWSEFDVKNKKRVVNYNGKIWCLSVPKTNFMVRRNGKAFFTGNSWAKEWLTYGARPIIWTQQGGQATINAYLDNPELMIKHRNFFDRAVKCYVDSKERLFVHGGFELGSSAEAQSLRYLSWDRYLYDARHNELDIRPYSEVFVGHTSTWNISHYPFQRNNVWFLDQGGGWEGKLTIMNVTTHKFWQSDKVSELYPGFHGR